MGRGIVESGLVRMERLTLEERTSDPSSTQEGEAWIRTDLSPDTNQLATLRFDNGSGTWDVPIYDQAATTENVSKALRLEVGGSTGFVPVTTSGGTFDALRLQHDGSAYAFHDALEASAIPDSEANQKLLHRWYLSESASPFVDQVGSADSTTTVGTTQVSGSQYVDGAARDGDGTDDNIQFTTLNDFGSSLDTDFAVAVTLSTTDNDATILGESHDIGGSRSYFHASIGTPVGGGITGGVPSGSPVLGLRDTNGDTYISYADSTVNDGSLTRLVINKTANSGSSGIEFWYDGVQQSPSNDGYDDNPSSFENFNNPLALLALSADSGPANNINSIVDDVCIFGSSLTQSEIESYSKP